MPLSQIRSVVSYVPQRWIVCALCSWAFAIITNKTTYSYMIADVVSTIKEKNTWPPLGGCPFLFSNGSWETRDLAFSLPDLYWNPGILDISNSAFQIGKLWVVVPSGILSDLGYSKYVLCGGMLLMVICQLVLPTFRIGVAGYIIESFFDGVTDGSLYPSIITLIRRWAPSKERNTFTAIVVAGLYYGDTLGYANFFLINSVFSSWRLGLYTTAVLGLVWLALGFIFIHHSPNESPFISHQEHLAITGRRRKISLQLGVHKLQGIPWQKIISSRPFLSLVLLFCSLGWLTYLNIYGILLPYQMYILHLPNKFSKRSTILVIVGLPSMLIGGFLADWIVNNKLVSKTFVTRAYVLVSMFGSSVLLVAATLIGCDVVLFWVLIIIAVYTLGLAASVIYSAPIDLCPRHAGLLMGLVVGAKTICSIFRTKLDERLDLFISDNYNSNHWRNVIILRAILGVLLAIPFLFVGSAEKQLWKHLNIEPAQSLVELEPSSEPN